MTYTARQLVTASLFLSGLVSSELEVPTGDQISTGLTLLNAVLAVKSMNTTLIPYYEYSSLQLVQGQELYFIPNLISIETTNFEIGEVRYPTQKINRTKYFGAPRVNNVQTLPSGWHPERAKGGMNLYVYPLPASNYTYNFIGKYLIQSVASLDVDLSLYFDAFYLEYLRYAVAEYVCSENNIMFQPQSAETLKSYEAILADVSPIDLTSQIATSFLQPGGMQWTFVNLYNGWLPS